MTSFLLPQKLPRLEAALRDARQGAPDSRWVAALALGQVRGGDQSAATRALQELISDPLEEIRAQALESLAEQARGGGEVDEQTVMGALEDTSAAVRCTAVDAALTILDDPLPHLLPLVGDEDPSVRATLAAVLGELRSAQALKPLQTLLGDSDEIVGFRAAAALAALGDASGENRLIASLPGRGERACDACLALGLSARATALPHLEKIARGLFCPIELKALAAAAMMRCSEGKRGAAVLRKLLRSRSAAKRLTLLTALCRLPVPEMIADVGELLQSRDETEVSAAMHTIVALAPSDPPAARRALETAQSKLKGELAAELKECLRSLTP